MLGEQEGYVKWLAIKIPPNLSWLGPSFGDQEWENLSKMDKEKVNSHGEKRYDQNSQRFSDTFFSLYT